MKVHRGDIVLVAFPFSDGSSQKIRPALVVQNDRNNERLQDTIVALITSTTERAGREPTQLLIDISTPPGRESGLLHSSAIKCENLFTLQANVIVRKLGHLAPASMEQVDRCLKSSLGIA